MTKRMFRLTGVLTGSFFTLFVLFLVGCGGSGGGSLSGSGPGGSAAPASAVDISLSPANAADITTFEASSTATPLSGDSLKPSHAREYFNHVWVKVEKIGLIPVERIPWDQWNKPDRDGECEDEDRDEDRFDDNGKGYGESHPVQGGRGIFIITLSSPVMIDLLNPPDGYQVAKFINKVSEVPAGTYGKIRVYYSEVKAEYPNGDYLLFHATANYHFDVHFVGKNLVIPVTTDPQDPAGAVRLYKLEIKVVGLKIHPAGLSGRWLLRPQVFARVKGALLYSVTGQAANVAPGTFDIVAGSGTFPARYGATTLWSFSDNVFSGGRLVAVTADRGTFALRNGAFVEAIGKFTRTWSPGLYLDANVPEGEVSVMFPDKVADKKVYLGWNHPVDNTFTLRFAGDNVVVPKPDRNTAIYDNAAQPYNLLTEGAIVDNAVVTVRGYARAATGLLSGGVDAFWISIAP